MTDFDFEKRDVVLCCCTFYQWIPNGHGQNDNFFSPLYLPPIDFFFFLGWKLAFLKNENPALAGLLVCGELWGCAQSLESVVATSENKSLNPPRFLEAEI